MIFTVNIYIIEVIFVDDDKMVSMILLGVKSYFDERDAREQKSREIEITKAKASEESRRKKRMVLDIITFGGFISLLIYGMHKFEIINIRNSFTLW